MSCDLVDSVAVQSTLGLRWFRCHVLSVSEAQAAEPLPQGDVVHGHHEAHLGHSGAPGSTSLDIEPVRSLPARMRCNYAHVVGHEGS